MWPIGLLLLVPLGDIGKYAPELFRGAMREKTKDIPSRKNDNSCRQEGIFSDISLLYIIYSLSLFFLLWTYIFICYYIPLLQKPKCHLHL